MASLSTCHLELVVWDGYLVKSCKNLKYTAVTFPTGSYNGQKKCYKKLYLLRQLNKADDFVLNANVCKCDVFVSYNTQAVLV